MTEDIIRRAHAVCPVTAIQNIDSMLDICQGVTQGITQLQIQWNMPISFGILTVNDRQQALDRAGGRLGNKGDEAAAAAIQMVHLQDEMDAASPENIDRKNIN